MSYKLRIITHNLYLLQPALIYPCHCFLVLIFQLQKVGFALENNGNLYEILYHADLSACKSLFQQRQILLVLEGLFVFLHGGVQVAGFFIELP